jgi:hypothetical protein
LLSPDQRDFAARLLRKAGEDLAAVQALLDNASISDDVISPWAAEFRYDEHEIVGFSRDESLQSAERAIEWAQAVFDAAS